MGSTTTPSNPFILVASNRTGSHLLKDLIDSSEQIPRLGVFLEDLSAAEDEEILSYFENMRPAGREHWGTMIRANQYLCVLRYLELVQVEPLEVKWIWLRRRNKVRQAVSRIRLSMMRERFPNSGRSFFDGLRNDDPAEKHEINQSKFKIPLDQLQYQALKYFIEDSAWEAFFRYYKITPHIIFYEDFMNESGWDSTIRGIFDFIGMSYTLPLELSTNRLKQAIDEMPKSYHILMRMVNELKTPIEYTDYSEGQ